MSTHNSTPESPLSNQPDKDNTNSAFNLNLDFLDKLQKEANEKFSQCDEQDKNNVDAFPVGVFPKKVQEIILATNECLNYPVDFFGTSILYAVALCIGNTYRVEVKTGWHESAVLFMANVGNPGAVKTHPLSYALDPIHKIQAKNFTAYEKLKKEYDRICNLSKEERKAEAVKEPVKPFFVKYTLTDFTPEALAEVHKNNKRGIAVYADELAGWFKNFNRYHKGAEAETWLSIWSGKQITIDRKGNEPLLIPCPFIPVGGNIQTAILSELAKDNRSQNGFIDRILFAMPEGLKKPYLSEKELQPSITEEWNRIVEMVLSHELNFDENMNPQPVILKFTPDAKNIFREWSDRNTDLVNAEDNEALKGVYTKLEIYVARLSLILEMMDWIYEGEITLLKQVGERAVNGAIRLIEYYRVMAVKVNSIISDYNPLRKYPEDKQDLYHALPDRFKKAAGLKIAEALKVPPDTFNKWLAKSVGELFRKPVNGFYEKLF